MLPLVFQQRMKALIVAWFEVKHVASWKDQDGNHPAVTALSFLSVLYSIHSYSTCFPARSPFCRAQADSVLRPFTTAAPGTRLHNIEKGLNSLYLQQQQRYGRKGLKMLKIGVSSQNEMDKQQLHTCFYFWGIHFRVLMSLALSGV